MLFFSSQLPPIHNKVSTLALIFFKSDAQNIPWKCVWQIEHSDHVICVSLRIFSSWATSKRGRLVNSHDITQRVNQKLQTRNNQLLSWRLEWIWTAPTKQHGDVFSRSPLVWSQDHSVLPLSRHQVEFMPSLKLQNGYVDEKTSPQPQPRHSGWNINLGWPVRRSRSPSTGAFATTECSDT